MKRNPFGRRAAKTAAALAALSLTAVPALAASSHSVSVGRVSHKTLIGGGTTRITTPAAVQTSSLFAAATPFREQFRFTPERSIPTLGGVSRQSARRALSIPQAAAVKMSASGTLFGFNGMTDYDQVYSGTGIYAVTNYELEPPDQALAVGNGFVLEAVNNAVTVHKTDGTIVAGPVPINQFFRQAPEIDRNGSGTFGESFSDPRAYYDPSTKRWFVEEWATATDPVTGATLPSSTIFLAVSKTSDPTGDYLIYAISTTFSGSTSDPVIPDYTMIGADENGVYLSTNTYSLVTGQFTGVSVFAIPKQALVNSAPLATPGYVEFDDVDSGNTFTLDPAQTPPGGGYATRKNGTEYFLSIYDGQSLGVYALINTKSLTTATPKLQFMTQNVATQAYPGPPPAEQKRGPRPLGNSYNQPQSVLETGGFRIMNCVYSNGKLYGSLDSAVLDANGETHAGIAYFILKPSFDTAGKFAAGVLKQGYVSVTGEDIMMPAIGVNKNNGMVMTFTLAGKDYFPSAAYATFAGDQPTVHIAKNGTATADGFSGYPIFGGSGEERWGDYSAAVADENGDIWMATEYIPNAPRLSFANWGTYIFKVTP